MIDRQQLETVFRALQEAHAYIAHPSSITPCASNRVATHRVPNHHFTVMERNARAALKTLNDILHADPVPT